MTTPRLQRPYGASPRLMTDREVDAFFAGKPMRRYPLPWGFYAACTLIALGLVVLYAIALTQ